jgi:hypothetical protein
MLGRESVVDRDDSAAELLGNATGAIILRRAKDIAAAVNPKNARLDLFRRPSVDKDGDVSFCARRRMLSDDGLGDRGSQNACGHGFANRNHIFTVDIRELCGKRGEDDSEFRVDAVEVEFHE